MGFKRFYIMSKENYDTKLVVLEVLPQEEVKSPTIPVDVFMQEAENLFVWAEEDKKTCNDLCLSLTPAIFYILC